MHDSAATTSELPADDYDYDYDVAPSRRMPRTTLALLIAVLIASGFASGVLVQKRHDKGLGSSASALPAGFPAGGFPGAGAGAPTTSARAAATGPVLVGTVVSVSGTTITVKDLGGTTHTVATTATTTVAKQEQQKLTDLTAGQTVSVNGTKADDGSVTATAVTLR